ncbi:MAG TPA: ABC transporter permease [Candidatus Sulfobium mesophilum]|jgi:putative ABC transport system permease protein|nr:ABC transporter permease [Candidatus Sulfobium mesophilum]
MGLLKLLFRNAFRHRLRTFLTVLGITIAILAFGMLRTVVGAWYAGVEASSATRLITRNSVSLVFFLPISYKEKIRQVPGVKEVGYSDWFGGVYKEEKNFFPNFATDAKTALELFPEFIVPEAQKNAFLRDRKGAIVGIKTAKRFGWKIGDLVTLRGTIFPGNWEFVIRGIYHGSQKSTDETQFFFHWNYLNESLKKTAPYRADKVGWFLVGITSPDVAADVAVAIDKLFENSLAETITETEKAFQLSFISMTEAIVVVIQLVSIIVIIIIMAVMANTMAMTVRERTGEYAIMKTLGFGGWHIAALILGESLVIAATGTLSGIALTFPAAKAFGDSLSQYFPIFNVARSTVYMEVAAGLIVAIVAAIFPIWRSIQLRIADGLRRIG